MHAADFVHLGVQGLYLSLILSLPMVVAAAVVGVLLAIVQAVTQIQEQTLGFAVKLVATAVVLLLTLNWMGHEMLSYTRVLFDLVPNIGR